MAAETKISWADHTFNPWRGCQRVSAACDNCYAAVSADRFFRKERLWEPGAERVRTSPST